MSTTTAGDLLARAHRLTRDVRDCTEPVTADRWLTFDATIQRLLTEVLGDGGRYVPLGDRKRHTLVVVVRGYPALPATAATVAHRPPASAAATPSGADEDAVTSPRRHLRLITDDPAAFTPLPAPDAPREGPAPADAADPHPLARLSCTLGAFTDLVHGARQRPEPWVSRRDELADITRHVACIALVAARYTLSHGRVGDLDRPLRVAQYAEQVLSQLPGVGMTATPSLSTARVTSEHHPAGTPLERLQQAAHAWNAAAGHEVDRTIPNAEALRTIAFQGAHLAAVTLKAARRTDATEGHRTALAYASTDLQVAGKLWDHLTTLNHPTERMVSASRVLFAELEDTASRIPGLDPPALQATLDALTSALDDLTTVMARARTLPERLVQSQLVFAPARRVRATPERLHDIAKGRYVAIGLDDLSAPVTWHSAASALEQLGFYNNAIRMKAAASSPRMVGSPLLPCL